MGIQLDSRHKRRASTGRPDTFRKHRKFLMGRPSAHTKLGEPRIRKIRVRGGNFKQRALRLDSGVFSWPSEGIARQVRIDSVVYNGANNEFVRTNTVVKGVIVQVDAAPFRLWYETYYGVPIGKKSRGQRTNKKSKKAAKLKKKADAAKHAANKKASSAKKAAAAKKAKAAEKDEEKPEGAEGTAEVKEEKAKEAKPEGEKKGKDGKKKEGAKKVAAKGKDAKEEKEATDAAKAPEKKKKKVEKVLSQNTLLKLAKRRKGHVVEPHFEEQFSTGYLLAMVASRPGQTGRADGYLLEGKELEFYLKKIQKK